MSYAFTRTIPAPVPVKMYGFQKVPPSEMHSIIHRMQKKTYISNLYHGERYQTTPCPPRLPSAVCRKAPPRSDIVGTPRRHMSDKEIDKMVRRLRVPTISTLASVGMLDPAYETRLRSETPLRIGTGDQRPKTTADYRKFMHRITRPTTASRSKHFCVHCDDPDLQCYMDLDFCDEQQASREEIDDIVSRCQTPTVASLRGIPECKRKPQRRCLSHSQRDQLPLVSGMPRSRDVDEIVQRLYASTHAIHVHRRNIVPQATSITSTQS